MPISRDAATELIKMLEALSFGPLPATGKRVVYVFQAEMAINSLVKDWDVPRVGQ